MMFWGWGGSILTLLLGGLAGWWFGASRARSETTRTWMTALEEAKTDGIITEEQRSQIIRMQGVRR